MNFSSALASFLGRWQQPAVSKLVPVGQVLAHETQSFGETLARVAESQVGRGELGGNNLGPDVVEYQKATHLAPGPWPWCAAFVCWCVWHAILSFGFLPSWTRPRTALAYGFESWARGTKGAWIVLTVQPGKSETWPRRGDIVTFTWSHVGIVTGGDTKTRRVETVEGNAGRDNVRDSDRGDGVAAKDHALSKIRRVIRFVG